MSRPRYLAGSIFGPGPRRPLGRVARESWLTAVAQAARSNSHLARVARALADFLGADGRCDPALPTIARRAGCARCGVIRNIAKLCKLGLLRRVRRVIRTVGGVEQTSNAYELTFPPPPDPPEELPAAPAAPVMSKPQPKKDSDLHLEGLRSGLHLAAEAMARGVDLLARRREQFARRMSAEYAARWRKAPT